MGTRIEWEHRFNGYDGFSRIFSNNFKNNPRKSVVSVQSVFPSSSYYPTKIINQSPTKRGNDQNEQSHSTADIPQFYGSNYS
jgi:hypothetical protein